MERRQCSNFTEEQKPPVCPEMEEILRKRETLTNELKCTKEKLQSCLSILEGPIIEQLEDEQHKYKQIEDVLCNARRGIGKIGNDFKTSLECMQEQIISVNKNLNNVRKINETIKCSVSCLTDDLSGQNPSAQLHQKPASQNLSEGCYKCKNRQSKDDLHLQHMLQSNYKEEKTTKQVCEVKDSCTCTSCVRGSRTSTSCWQYISAIDSAINKLKCFIQDFRREDNSENCCQDRKRSVASTSRHSVRFNEVSDDLVGCCCTYEEKTKNASTITTQNICCKEDKPEQYSNNLSDYCCQCTRETQNAVRSSQNFFLHPKKSEFTNTRSTTKINNASNRCHAMSETCVSHQKVNKTKDSCNSCCLQSDSGHKSVNSRSEIGTKTGTASMLSIQQCLYDEDGYSIKAKISHNQCACPCDNCSGSKKSDGKANLESVSRSRKQQGCTCGKCSNPKPGCCSKTMGCPCGKCSSPKPGCCKTNTRELGKTDNKAQRNSGNAMKRKSKPKPEVRRSPRNCSKPINGKKPSIQQIKVNKMTNSATTVTEVKDACTCSEHLDTVPKDCCQSKCIHANQNNKISNTCPYCDYLKTKNLSKSDTRCKDVSTVSNTDNCKPSDDNLKMQNPRQPKSPCYQPNRIEHKAQRDRCSSPHYGGPYKQNKNISRVSGNTTRNIKVHDCLTPAEKRIPTAPKRCASPHVRKPRQTKSPNGIENTSSVPCCSQCCSERDFKHQSVNTVNDNNYNIKSDDCKSAPENTKNRPKPIPQANCLQTTSKPNTTAQGLCKHCQLMKSIQGANQDSKKPVARCSNCNRLDNNFQKHTVATYYRNYWNYYPYFWDNYIYNGKHRRLSSGQDMDYCTDSFKTSTRNEAAVDTISTCKKMVKENHFEDIFKLVCVLNELHKINDNSKINSISSYTETNNGDDDSSLLLTEYVCNCDQCLIKRKPRSVESALEIFPTQSGEVNVRCVWEKQDSKTSSIHKPIDKSCNKLDCVTEIKSILEAIIEKTDSKENLLPSDDS